MGGFCSYDKTHHISPEELIMIKEESNFRLSFDQYKLFLSVN